MNILWELTVSAEFPKKFRTRKLGEIFYLMKNDIYFSNFFVLGDHYLDYEDWGEYRRAVSSYGVSLSEKAVGFIFVTLPKKKTQWQLFSYKFPKIFQKSLFT